LCDRIIFGLTGTRAPAGSCRSKGLSVMLTDYNFPAYLAVTTRTESQSFSDEPKP
jgi:hypothetical protein